MYIQNEIYKDPSRFTVICRTFRVKSLYAFGACVTDHFDPDTNDIELLVDFEERELFTKEDSFLFVSDKLKILFHREVNLYMLHTIQDPILLERINANKVLLYDSKRKVLLI